MSGLARALVQAGRLTASQADAVQKKAALDRIAFIDALLSSGSIDAAALAHAATKCRIMGPSFRSRLTVPGPG